VALCSLVLYNGTTPNPETGKPDAAFGYVQVMNDYLPIGFRGLLLASFAAAYMSTIATQMNWGASYIINDFYRRFVKTDASEKHYVFASRMATLIIVLLSIVVTYFMNRITSGWELVLALGAGTGLVYILRWYWWRINAWSEIAAMACALVVSLSILAFEVFDSGTPEGFAQQILVTVGVTTLVWLAVTFATAPEPMEKLISFYRAVHPAGTWWRPVAHEAGIPERRGEIGPNILNWFLGIVLVYSTLFGIGEMIFGNWSRAVPFMVIVVSASVLMKWNLNRTGWAGLSETEERTGAVVAEGAD
jgi:Na+/proline symporter